MGAVSIDIYKKEKEYRHLTLSDEHVVKYLIEFRSQVDVSYGASTNINIYVAGDTMDFNVELIALYTSLDNILEQIEMKERERHFLELLFVGHRVGDIIKHYGYPNKTAYRILKRIVGKVVEVNKCDWEKSMRSQGFLKGEASKTEKGQQ